MSASGAAPLLLNQLMVSWDADSIDVDEPGRKRRLPGSL
jgi:hypothetical protein